MKNIISTFLNELSQMPLWSIIVIVLLVFIFIGVSDILNMLYQFRKGNRVVQKKTAYNSQSVSFKPQHAEVTDAEIDFSPIEVSLQKKNKKISFQIYFSEVPFCVFNEIKLWNVDEIKSYDSDSRTVCYQMKKGNPNLENKIENAVCLFDNRKICELIDKYGTKI